MSAEWFVEVSFDEVSEVLEFATYREALKRFVELDDDPPEKCLQVELLDFEGRPLIQDTNSAGGSVLHQRTSTPLKAGWYRFDSKTDLMRYLGASLEEAMAASGGLGA